MTGTLLVEDEVLISHSLEDALKEAGFEVQLAFNGKEAMKALDENGTGIAALITDIRVPKSVMLAKPFAIAQLVTAVSQLLNDSATQLG